MVPEAVLGYDSFYEARIANLKRDFGANVFYSGPEPSGETVLVSTVAHPSARIRDAALILDGWDQLLRAHSFRREPRMAGRPASMDAGRVDAFGGRRRKQGPELVFRNVHGKVNPAGGPLLRIVHLFYRLGITRIFVIPAGPGAPAVGHNLFLLVSS